MRLKGYENNDMIPSNNSGVREALETYVVRMGKEILKREMINAASDPLFLKDTNVNIRTAMRLYFEL